MAFNLTQFGSNSSNIKSILGGVNRYYYYNKDGNTLTTPGYFPNNLGLDVGDRIQVVPKVKTDPEEIYVVSSVVDGVVTVTQIDTDGAVDSVNGKTGHVVLDASDVHALPDSTVIPNAIQYETMPIADASNVGQIVEYVGATDSTYTNGYFYKNQSTPVYTGTVEFSPASISGVTTTCSGNAFANFIVANGSGNVTDIIKGTLTYDQSGDLLVFVGLDDTDTQVCTFQLYTQDYIDAGFTFSGTLSDGDVIAFTCTVSESAVYAWNRIDVQPTVMTATGFDATKTQTLKNVNGVLTWVDDVL